MKFYAYTPEEGVFLVVQGASPDVCARMIRPYLMDKSLRGEAFSEISMSVGGRLLGELEASGFSGTAPATPTTASSQHREASVNKMAKSEANTVLSWLDRLASDMQGNPVKYGFDETKLSEVLSHIDAASDGIEAGVFGEDSLAARQAEVLQRQPDEPHVDTFQNPQKPIQKNPDEPYINEFQTDTSGEMQRTFGSRTNPFRS